MKRLVSLTTAIVMCVAMMCSCGKDESKAAEVSEETSTAQEEPENTVDKGTMNGLDAKELMSQMKTGWNLGNALDSLGGKETSWGNPETTQTMIDMVHEAGLTYCVCLLPGASIWAKRPTTLLKRSIWTESMRW